MALLFDFFKWLFLQCKPFSIFTCHCLYSARGFVHTGGLEVLMHILYHAGVLIRCVFNQENLLHVQCAVCHKHIPVFTLPPPLVLFSANVSASSVVSAACFVVSIPPTDRLRHGNGMQPVNRSAHLFRNSVPLYN